MRIQTLLKLALLCLVLPAWQAFATVVESPVGIYRLTSEVTQKNYYLFISEFGFLGRIAHLAEIPNPGQTTHTTYIPFWRAEWLASEKRFSAVGSNTRDVNALDLQFSDADNFSGSIVSTNADFIRALGINALADINVRGSRVPEELALIALAESSSLVRDNSYASVQGTYEGEIVSRRRDWRMSLKLQLRAVISARGERIWMGSLKVGDFTNLPLEATGDRNGLIRFRRSNGPIPGEISGLLATVVDCAQVACVNREHRLELRGIFFVPRNGRFTEVTLGLK